MTQSSNPTTTSCSGLLALSLVLAACGGGGEAQTAASQAPPTSAMPAAPDTSVAPGNTPLAVVLPTPQLTFTDTGLSVSDGVTVNGLWTVVSDLSWEYSLDEGATWTLGSGGQFEVTGDGPKVIWVRARDELGNTSEIVKVSCVLDTMAPMPPVVESMSQGAARTLQVSGTEAGARWEYSLDQEVSWLPGSGTRLVVMGNSVSTVSVRQVDVAGNASAGQAFVLDQPGDLSWQEASGNPLQPSVLATSTAGTFLMHGSVVRGDADYIRWDVPPGHRVTSLRLVRYVSDDAVAFYALQRSAVFDAGVDVSKMLVYGHMGPQDLRRDVVAEIAPQLLGEGPMTLWFQQTGPLPTAFAMELVIRPLTE
jgi:hypothetical protein